MTEPRVILIDLDALAPALRAYAEKVNEWTIRAQASLARWEQIEREYREHHPQPLTPGMVTWPTRRRRRRRAA